MNKKRIIIVVAVLVVIGGLIWFFSSRDGSSGGQQVSNLDATDTVGNFYDQWLKAIKEPTIANPNRVTLMKSPLLSKTFRDRLAKESTLNASPDPVLCQTKTPEKIITSRVYEEADKAQLLVMSREKGVPEAAIVTLAKGDGGWYIDQIECTKGDIPPPVGEFSFEREGYLLKGSMPPPYNSKNWHVVFEENGVAGHAAPLFFDSASQCTSLGGVQSLCKPDEFKEGLKVFVRGQMSERGVSVKKLEFVKWK